MGKDSLEDRIERFLVWNPQATRVPLHPDDYAMYKHDTYNGLPVVCIGFINAQRGIDRDI